jgi:hypothetical protein
MFSAGFPDARGTAAATAVTVTVPPTGPVSEATEMVSLLASAASSVIVPRVCVAVADATVTAAETVAVVRAAANAGTADKSPNPSEATATTATFFNEIVFTIFLSFSRIWAFPAYGWCEFGTIISNE